MTRAREKMYIVANGCKSEKGVSDFIFDFNSQNYTASNFTKKSIEAMRNNHRYNMENLLKDKYAKIYEPEKYLEIKNKEIEVNKEFNNTKIIDNNLLDKSKEIISIIDLDSAINYFKSKNIEVIDKREKGGALWIVGGVELTNDMEILSMNKIKFKYLKSGGKSTDNRPSWYLIS